MTRPLRSALYCQGQSQSIRGAAMVGLLESQDSIQPDNPVQGLCKGYRSLLPTREKESVTLIAPMEKL